MENTQIDIGEGGLILEVPGLLDILLKDMTTGKNLLWGTDDYAGYGEGYGYNQEIKAELITGEQDGIIQPRISKSREAQLARVRNKGEVFTPAWVCNYQNNQVDGDVVFNNEYENGWKAIGGKIEFNETDKRHPNKWKRYVGLRRLEITCGEAPYLVSRYDAATGEVIPLQERIGLLDRKMRVVNEHVRKETGWRTWARKAVQSIYGYEWQGDNVLLARENILFTLSDYYVAKFAKPMPKSWLLEFARIIAWNIWQMDGLKYVVPCTCHEKKIRVKTKQKQLTLFKKEKAVDLYRELLQPCIGCGNGDIFAHNGVYAKIKDWRTKRIFRFVELADRNEMIMMGKRNDFKFDVVIGNPPYQDDSTGEQKTFYASIYNDFMDEAYKVAEAVELIHPGRFLFKAGNTPKVWNEKMLADNHFKVLRYEQDSKVFFPGRDIKGGIAISYRNANEDFGAIDTFTAYDELNTIHNKVVMSNEQFQPFSKLIYGRNIYRFTKKMHEDNPQAAGKLSKGHANDLSANIFDRLPEVFFEDEPDDGNDYIRIYGRQNNTRVYRYVRRDYITQEENLDRYKVIVPAANGSGAIGEVLSTPLIGTPLIGTTETFITIGAFSDKKIAEAVFKYIKTKFCRTMLGILKSTQHNTAEKWAKVPMQDFSAASDIDWSQSIREIDGQLYRKYGLTEKEIAFIESKVKEMD